MAWKVWREQRQTLVTIYRHYVSKNKGIKFCGSGILKMKPIRGKLQLEKKTIIIIPIVLTFSPLLIYIVLLRDYQATF